MKKTKQKKIQTNKRLMLSELSDFFYKLENGLITSDDNTSLPLEKNHTGSILYIDEKKLIIHSFEEDNAIIENSDIDNLIETRLLKETQLDNEVEYSFFYKKRISVTDSRKSHILVYAVPENYIKEEYGEIANNIDYIDYITTPTLMPEILYEKAILESDKTDIFIYFGINNSFISIFIDGKYIYSKDFPVSLEDIYENLAHKLQQQISLEDFKLLLIERGFDINAYEGDDINILDLLINDIFHDTFIKINQIITSARRMLNIEKVHRVFIGTEIGSIPSMNEYAKEKLANIEALDFSFTEHTSISPELSGKVSPLIELGDMLLSAESSEIVNFTEFKHPLPFLKRPTAKPLLLAGAGIAGILLFLGSQVIYLNSLKSTIHDLEAKNSSFKASLAETEAYKKKILGEKNKLIEEEKGLQVQLNKQIERLKSLKIQINSNESTTGYIINVFKELTMHGLVLKSFTLNGREIILNIETPKHLNIGTFTNKILETNLYKVYIGAVSLNPKTGVYQTNIKLQRIN